MRRKLLHRLKHEREVGVAVATAHRPADGKKHEVGVTDRRIELGREADPPHAQIALLQLSRRGP
jgi:hypothetical protein